MLPNEFSYLQRFLRNRIGLHLGEDKIYLIKSRARALLVEHGLESVNELSRKIRFEENGVLAEKLLEAMTTNETLFFRDEYPFKALKEHIFPELLQSRSSSRRLSMWSAACSTGQEPYSMAIASREFGLLPEQVRILATDVSRNALERAMRAEYSSLEVQRGMPDALLGRYFEQAGSAWRLRDAIRQMVRFKHANLIEDGLETKAAAGAPYDVVFCRNVLIYFDPEERRRVIDRLGRLMRPGSYLVTGAAETPSGDQSRWQDISFCGKRIWRLI